MMILLCAIARDSLHRRCLRVYDRELNAKDKERKYTMTRIVRKAA